MHVLHVFASKAGTGKYGIVHNAIHMLYEQTCSRALEHTHTHTHTHTHIHTHRALILTACLEVRAVFTRTGENHFSWVLYVSEISMRVYRGEGLLLFRTRERLEKERKRLIRARL